MSQSATIQDDNAPHLLIVDDDDRIRTLLKKFLSENGFHASMAENAAQARQMMKSLHFDLLILDVMMPGETGFELTRSLRTLSNIPIILLTARGQPEDRIEGLELGADDYLAKPFEPRELLLRIRALLKRHRESSPQGGVLTFGACSFNPDKGVLRRDGAIVRLTSGELALLRALARKPGAAIARHALAQSTSSALDRSIDVQVTRLRKKIEEDPRNPLILQTVRGVGYALMTD